MVNRRVLGLTEDIVVIGKENQNLKVRIDTGATCSSIDIKLANQLGWGPVVRNRIVKSASGIKKREMVKGEVVIQSLQLEGEFTLADRSHMTYPILIGQNILKEGMFLVDPMKD